jgi:uncharacterized protein (TIRG00374 family)
MINIKQYGKRKPVFLAIKLIFTITSVAYIYWRVSNNSDIESAFNLFSRNLLSQSLLIPAVVILLMPVNWGLEAYKWKLILTEISNISFLSSINGVIGGIAISFISPFRIGEVIGRVFFLENTDKVKATLLNIIASWAQVFWTVSFGLIACYLFILNYKTEVQISNVTIILIGLLVVVLIAATAFAIPIINLIYKTLKIKWLNKYENYFNFFLSRKPSELITALLISFLRYIVFSTQLYLLLLFFGINITVTDALVFIPIIFSSYSILSFFPLFGGIGVREAVTVVIFGQISQSVPGIVAASLSLWIINIIIPALYGSIFLLPTLKLKKAQ